jgi:hypothetical protein
MAMPVSKKRHSTNQGPTPPKSPAKSAAGNPSPPWYAPMMFTFMGIGVLTIMATYMFSLDRIMLLPGLGAMAVGMFMTLGYR